MRLLEVWLISWSIATHNIALLKWTKISTESIVTQYSILDNEAVP